MRCEWWIRIPVAGEKIQPAAAPIRPQQTARNDNPRRPPRRAVFKCRIVKVKVRTDRTAPAVAVVIAGVAAIPAANPEERERLSHTSS